MSAIELKIAGRRGVHQLSWQKLVPISETISRFQVGKWWNLTNEFANCEIAIEIFPGNPCWKVWPVVIADHLPEGVFCMVSNYLSLVLNIFSNNFSSGWQHWRGCGEGREAACRSCCQLRSKLPQFKAPGFLTPFNLGGFESSSITGQ